MEAARVASLALAAALLLGACGRESPEEPPAGADSQRLNLLLVTIDTLRADALGAYTPGLATSPRIDSLAAEGVLFEQCLSSTPSTLPGHATILTGKQPYAHGVRSNYGYVLPAANLTLAEVLRKAGYVTGAEIAAVVIKRGRGLDQGFLQYRDPTSYDARLMLVNKRTPQSSERLELQERAAADITRRAIEFLRRQREAPFFLWLHYFDPHVPYFAPPEFRNLFPGDPYHAEVAYTDQQVGLVIDELRRLGLAERTLVVVTSDHGEGLGEHGEDTHSYLVYDSTMRVPLILWGPPGLPRGRRVGALVRTVDIAPTALDWLGLSLLEGVQGVSLRPLIHGQPLDRALTGYGESIEAYATFGASVLRFVRQGRWKYIHKVNPELYDVREDPRELENRAATEGEVLARARSQLEALIREAPPPPSGAEIEVDSETLAQLDALGYVGSTHRPAVADELASLEVSGVDPNSTLDDMRRYSAAVAKANITRDYESAIALLAELLERYPRSAPLLRKQSDALRAVGRRDEAVPLMRRALELDPADVDLRMDVVDQLQRSGELDEAEGHARLAVEQHPCLARAVAYLSNVLHDQERYGEQRALLAGAIERCPDPDLRNEYAYFLATCPDASHRDGAEALRLALEITRGQGGVDPVLLDTLAAAYAETGDFERAVETSRRALALIESRDAGDEVLAIFRGHLSTLEAGQPIREL